MSEEKTKHTTSEESKSDGNQSSTQALGSAVEDNFLTETDNTIDEELLALSPPPPSIQQAIFIVIIIAFSFLLLYLFLPELRYFVKGFSQPITLGEAADVQSKNLQTDSYVRVEGVPLINRTVTFSTGTKWFSGDIFRKMAPLSGNPNVMVQWHTNNPEIRQAKDALTPPSSFAGRLKKRSDLSDNYNKFWPFYDCLKLHNTSQCKYCIGKKDLAECRPIFTCVDNYPIEVCDRVAFFTPAEVEEKVAKLKGELKSHSSTEVAAELALHEQTLAAIPNLRVISDLVAIEELFDRISLLQVPAAQKSTAFSLRKQLLDLQFQALQIRLSLPIGKIKNLSPALSAKLSQSQQELTDIRQKIVQLEAAKSAIIPLVDINTELSEFVELVTEQQEKLRRINGPIDALSQWKLDGNETGAVLLAKVRDLSALLASMKLAPRPAATPSDAAEDTDATGDSAADTSSDNAAIAAADETPDSDSSTANASEPNALAPLTDPLLSAIDASLQNAIEKVAEVGRQLIHLAPGDAPELDAWAGNTDIVGSLPKPLRADHVFKSFELLRKMILGATPSADTSLKLRLRGLISQLEQAQSVEKKLAGSSGLNELSLVQQFDALQKSATQIKTEKDLQLALGQLQELNSKFASMEFYPWDLDNFPSVKQGLFDLVQQADLPALETQVTTLENRFAPPLYVLLDGEKPTDNPWILFVYIAIPVMLIVNFRKLYRFIAEWRQ